MQVALTPLGAVTVASSGGDLANIVAGAQPIRTVMSNSLGLALMGGLGVVLVLLVGTRLVILRRQS